MRWLWVVLLVPGCFALGVSTRVKWDRFDRTCSVGTEIAGRYLGLWGIHGASEVLARWSDDHILGVQSDLICLSGNDRIAIQGDPVPSTIRSGAGITGGLRGFSADFTGALPLTEAARLGKGRWECRAGHFQNTLSESQQAEVRRFVATVSGPRPKECAP